MRGFSLPMVGVVQRLAHQLVELKMGVRFPSPTLMSNENEYFIVSTGGFGGLLYRASQKYIEKGQTIPITPQERGTVGNIFITKTLIQSSTGELLNIIARDKNSKTITEVSLIQPTDSDDYCKFIDSRNLEVETTDLPPIKFALAILAQALMRENQERSPVERFKEILITESLFPFQNIEGAFTSLEQKMREGLPFNMGCFVCLNTKCTTRNGLPVFYLGQDEKRLTTPKLTRRTQQLINSLDETMVPYQIDILIADTDIYDVNGDWLDTPDQSDDIYAYQQKLSPTFSNISSRFEVKLWSDVQAPFQDQYTNSFRYAYINLGDLIGEEYIQRSIDRRLDYFSQLGIQPNPEIRQICDTTARRNVSLYAAQGPILNQEYDCLIIADPDPLRLGKIQSLLTPDLPIWYPYSG